VEVAAAVGKLAPRARDVGFNEEAGGGGNPAG